MDSVQLDNIRGKILRIREIEQGLADSNAETVSSDLALCRDEADKLLRGFTEEKEERLRLIDGLKNLSHKINGLTTGDLDELHRQAEMKEQHLAAQKGTLSRQEVTSIAHLACFQLIWLTILFQDQQSQSRPQWKRTF
jgi:hypothetical protein